MESLISVYFIFFYIVSLRVVHRRSSTSKVGWIKKLLLIGRCQICEMGPKSGTSSDQEDLQEVLSGSWQSTTPACKPMTHDKMYYFLPYWDDKPCLHVRSIWPDYRRRMYNSNIISKISDKLVSRQTFPS